MLINLIRCDIFSLTNVYGKVFLFWRQMSEKHKKYLDIVHCCGGVDFDIGAGVS